MGCFQLPGQCRVSSDVNYMAGRHCPPPHTHPPQKAGRRMWFPLCPWRLTLRTPIWQEVHFPGQEDSAALPSDLGARLGFLLGRYRHPGVFSSLNTVHATPRVLAPCPEEEPLKALLGCTKQGGCLYFSEKSRHRVGTPPPGAGAPHQDNSAGLGVQGQAVWFSETAGTGLK